MHRCFPLFLALALPAFAAEPVGVAEFEAHVRAVVLRAGNRSISVALDPDR